MAAVGAYLQQHRKAKGLTQEDVAKQLDVTSRTVSDWEAGRHSPSFDLMVRFVQLVGGRIEEVVSRFYGAGESALTQAERDRILALADTDEKRAQLLRRIAELTENPELRARIEGYLDGLEAADRA